MKIAIIILNYNKKELLEKCLISIEKIKYSNFKAVVVDNGSEDGSEYLVRNKFPSAKFIPMGYNSGFCKGNNIGINFALKNNFDGVLLLNNDTEADPNLLNHITKKIKPEEKIGMIAPKILYLKKPNIIDSGGFLITPDGIGKNWGSGEEEKKYSEEREVFCPSGAATFYCRKLLEDVKYNSQYFDEDYEFNYEELDLGWRARLRGWKCLYIPNAVVYHIGSATGGSFSSFFAYYSNRNLYFNIIKNYPSVWLLFKALVLSLLRYAFYFFGLFQKRGVASEIIKKSSFLGIIGVVFKSFFDALKKMPKMIKKRKIIQEGRRVDKKEISRWFKDLGLTFFDSVYRL
jgi:GT2 family glycosyltransferase